jgi:hypothetical protein
VFTGKEITYSLWMDSEILFFATVVAIAFDDVPLHVGVLFPHVPWPVSWDSLGLLVVYQLRRGVACCSGVILLVQPCLV